MTTVKLPTVWSDRLAQQPESGMGYHKANITLTRGVVLKDINILNGSDCQVPLRFNPLNIVDIQVIRK